MNLVVGLSCTLKLQAKSGGQGGYSGEFFAAQLSREARSGSRRSFKRW
ncbi:MAG: hypothetical protein ACRDBL_15335 [Rhabdaerophilum sp.]